MKKTDFILNNSLAGVFLIVLLATIQGCHPKHDVPVQEVVTKQITAKQWKAIKVTVDGVDQSQMFSDFAVKFTSEKYTTINGGEVWPESDTWLFKNGEGKVIIRNSDKLEVAIESINESSLVLNLMWMKTTYGGGRTGSIRGQHRFEFIGN
jgi:hypothetical protein